MKLVVAICGVQSEQFLEKTLDSLSKTDVDAIHYMDGSWEHTGLHLLHSDDKTQNILNTFKEKSHIEVIHDYSVYGWKTQSQKRNAQLFEIECIYKRDTWVLVIDDDEVLDFDLGRLHKFKPFLNTQGYGIGTIDSVAPPPGQQLADLQIMKTARFIRLGYDFHYHTETNMLVHDRDCKTMCDYHNERKGIIDPHVFSTPYVKVTNFWMQRTDERLKIKNTYYKYLNEANQSMGECKFNE